MVEDAVDRAAHTIIESLGGVGVDLPTGVLSARLMDRLVGRERVTCLGESSPLVAHQMGAGINGLGQHALGLGLRQVSDD